MTNWKIATATLCIYGFFKEMRPSEPYLAQYFMYSKNFTAEEVQSQILPVWTYSYLAVLVLVLLFTDAVRYKPCLVLEGISYVITWVVMIWSRDLAAMQASEFTYGVATATEIAYYAYIYSVVSPDYYKKATSYIRAAILSGRTVAYLLCQLLYFFRVADLYDLNCISLGSVSVALIISFVLPAVTQSVYHDRDVQNSVTANGDPFGNNQSGNDTEQDVENQSDTVTDDSSEYVDEEQAESDMSCVTVEAKQLWSIFRKVYTNKFLLTWSIWWALASCGNLQVNNYIQNLWDDISPMRTNKNLYNGGVQAVTTLLGKYKFTHEHTNNSQLTHA
jgi:thiamine transporter 2/3